MLLMIGVSLYTVRVVLSTLGVIDYGIYNVVGGIVTMFGFLSITMASASQRFFAFELGQKNYEQLKKTFSLTIIIYTILALVIIVLAETVGLWFLNNKMTIPVERMEAARWIYQFSILSFLMTMFAIPYNAAIIAHERMNVYAYVSILEVTLKLIIIYFLVVFPFDKLKLYAVLMTSVTGVITFIYIKYCKRKFEECSFSFHWDKILFKKIVSYSGWNLFGALASLFNNQGVSIILNLFFGPLVNAAQAIAYQVNGAINLFIQNYMVAVRPQIIKYYAADEKMQMLRLVFQSSKLSFLLLYILTMPVLLETNFIFEVWLKEVPEYVVLFTRLVIIAALIDTFSQPLVTVAQATGDIKKYQFLVGGVMLLNLPTSYMLFKFGCASETVFYLSILVSVVCLFLRLKLLEKMVELPVMKYLNNVIIPLLITALFAYIVPFFLSKELDAGFLRLFFVIVASISSSLITAYLIALTKQEKEYIVLYSRKLWTRLRGRKDN